jgi:hypothetical protein
VSVARESFSHSARYRSSCPAPGRVALLALLLLATSVKAEPPAKPSEQQSETELNTITVEAARNRAILEHRVDKFVYGITVTPFGDSIAR